MVGHVAVPSILISQRFLTLLGAPKYTISLSFNIEAGGLLRCKAVYYTDVKDETSVKEWEVNLPRTSAFYRLIIGEIS